MVPTQHTCGNPHSGPHRHGLRINHLKPTSNLIFSALRARAPLSKEYKFAGQELYYISPHHLTVLSGYAKSSLIPRLCDKRKNPRARHGGLYTNPPLPTRDRWTCIQCATLPILSQSRTQTRGQMGAVVTNTRPISTTSTRNWVVCNSIVLADRDVYTLEDPCSRTG
jgi:hypothetical protein